VSEYAPPLARLAEEIRDLERRRVATWLLDEAIRIAQEGDVAIAARIRMLAKAVRENRIELLPENHTTGGIA
jgi:hypothetical protein